MSVNRVLHVVGIMNRGGLETFIMNVYRNVDHSKIQFDFLTHRSEVGAFDEEIRSYGGRIYNVPFNLGTGHFQYLKELDKFFVSHQEYKIVHSHMNEVSGLILQSAKKAGVEVRIAHSHTSYPSYGILKTLYYKKYAKILIPKNATHFFACSSKAGKYLFGEKNYCKNKVVQINNGVDPEKYIFNQKVRERIRDELHVTRDTIVLGHVGSFQEVKNHSFLVDIFSKVKKGVPNSILLLIGDGPLKSMIEQKVLDLKIEESVFFLGIRDNVPEILQAMDILLFPSLFEGLPVTLIEAQAAGLNCIVSNTITREVDLEVDLIKFISLHDTSSWIESVKGTSINHNRLNTSDKVSEKGYNIKDTASILQKFYLSNGELE